MSLHHKLLAFTKTGSVIHTGAHPDDEDTGVISYLACKHGLKTFYWSATRGEKGQNHVNYYKDEALGIFRTWESLAAAKINHSHCLFGPFVDFGYCKTADSAFIHWNNLRFSKEIDLEHELLTKYLVRTIRQHKPLIVISRWSGTSQDFHGQHQAVGIATQRAFDMAANPRYYPDLINAGFYPWQPLKLYISQDNSGGNQNFGGALNISGMYNPALEKENILRINTGEMDPLATITYQERAWHAYMKHRSQALIQVPRPGDFYYYLELKKSLVASTELDLIAGFDLTLPGFAQTIGITSTHLLNLFAEIQQEADAAFTAYSRNTDTPHETAAEHLIKALQHLRCAENEIQRSTFEPSIKSAIQYYISEKICNAQELIASTLNLHLEGLINSHYLIPGKEFVVAAQLWNYGVAIDKVKFSIQAPSHWQITKLPSYDLTVSLTDPEKTESGQLYREDHAVTVGQDATYHQPYWLRYPNQATVYRWPHTSWAGEAFEPPSFILQSDITIAGTNIRLTTPISYREARHLNAREIIPQVILPITITPLNLNEFFVEKDLDQTVKLPIRVRLDENLQGVLEGKLVVAYDTDAPLKISPLEIPIKLHAIQNMLELIVNVTIPANTKAGCYPINFHVAYGQNKISSIITAIMQGPEGTRLPTLPNEDNCIKQTFITKPTTVSINLIPNVFITGLKYGYIVGEDKMTPLILKNLGLSIYEFLDSDIAQHDLMDFDAIIIGINAYFVRNALQYYAMRLLDYTANGGTLIVQYQRYNYANKKYVPYKFSYDMPHTRITQKDAPVEILHPEHLIFNVPNVINQHDFEGWVMDRGLYFWKDWDEKHYLSLLGSHDSGEPMAYGGLLLCNYGRGTYLYTGYSFFRQIPAGIHGALRLFANILATPKHRIIERIKFLKKVPILSKLHENHLEEIARSLVEIRVENNSYICHQGERGHELYIIVEGQVDVIKEEENSQQKIITTMSTGDFVGEFAILADIPRTASLRAHGDVRLFVMAGSSFQQMLTRFPEMVKKILKLLVHTIVSSSS